MVTSRLPCHAPWRPHVGSHATWTTYRDIDLPVALICASFELVLEHGRNSALPARVLTSCYVILPTLMEFDQTRRARAIILAVKAEYAPAVSMVLPGEQPTLSRDTRR
jgi:hypothetical protein